MDEISPPAVIPSSDELSVQVEAPKRAKSPPLAFEPTPNDSLAPFVPTPAQIAVASTSASSPPMGRLSALQEGGREDLQVIIEQQGAALQLLHNAFAAERQAWSLEKERLYYRIASLERLLKTADGYSPAKSPALSPVNGSLFASPHSKATTNSQRLPSIAEYEDIPSLSQRRAGAPQSIDIPTLNMEHSPRNGSVSFAEVTRTSIHGEEPSVAPADTAVALSPPPFYNRMEAGHTPLRAPRPLTPPPNNSLSIAGIEDTPTRENTHINALLSRSSDEDEDKELTGPLNMPELPRQPDETNFTFEMLSKRLAQIEKSPDEGRPMVFNERSPGLASPKSEQGDVFSSQKTAEQNVNEEAPSTHTHESSTSDPSSNVISPNSTFTPLSRHASREQEEKAHAEIENGGIKLKKKPSENFGAPFGQLGGFGNMRKMS